jgi:transcriptional regulator with XRE-family HTH domain
MHRFSPSEGEALDRFAAVLRDLRRRSGQTRDELARASRLSASYIKDLEAGVRRPRFLTLQRLASGLAPARGRSRKDGSVRFPGSPEYRRAWSEDYAGASMSVFHELLLSAEGAVAPSREEARARHQTAG